MNANNNDFLEGKVTSTNPNTNLITVDVDYATGTGSASVWDVNITGQFGHQGYQGVNSLNIRYYYSSITSGVPTPNQFRLNNLSFSFLIY